MRSRLAVIMVADVVGYSRLMAADEMATIAVVREINDDYLEPAVKEYDGEVLKRMGDGWIVAFSSVTSAVQSCVASQKNMVNNPNVKLRIGMHIGEITEDEADFFGAGVNLAARLQAEAPPGGIMISEDLYRHLTGKLANLFEDAGNFDLKNIPYPVNAYQWRPEKTGNVTFSDVPVVFVDKFRFAPNDRETEAAAVDLHDQLFTNLARRTGIKVVENDQKTAPTYKLTGRLRLADKFGRLNLSLTNSETGIAIFSNTYQEDTSDIFEFFDKIANRADADLRMQINAFDGERLSHIPENELSVSELRTMCSRFFYLGTYEGWSHGRDLVDRAVGMNPTDPMSLAMRAVAEMILAAARYEKLPKEKQDALEQDFAVAIEALPHSDFIFMGRSTFHCHVKHDYAAAMRDIERCLSITPNYVVGLNTLGTIYMSEGKFEEAIEAFQRAGAASSRDPMETMRLFPLALAHYCSGQYEEAIEAADRAIQISRDQRALYVLRALCYTELGDEDSVRRCKENARQMSGRPSVATAMRPLPPEFEELQKMLAPTEPLRKERG